MDDVEGLLAPVEGHVTLTRNSTELSRFSERIVITFLGYHASEARVRYEETDYDMETLYRGLRNVCVKSAFRGLVKPHKQDGQLMLVRMRP